MGNSTSLGMGAAAIWILLMGVAGFCGAEESGQPFAANPDGYRALLPRLNLPDSVEIEEPYRPGEWADIHIPIRNDGEGTLILRRVNTG